MSNIANIRILEKEANKRGDLFARLMKDLFLALGYDNPWLNIHKSGREIDIEAAHRTESKRMIAECKTTKDEIGGADINKFVGAMDAEKRKYKAIIYRKARGERRDIFFYYIFIPQRSQRSLR